MTTLTTPTIDEGAHADGAAGPGAATSTSDRPALPPHGGARRFLTEVRDELSQVVWPSWRQVRGYTATVLGFLLAMVALTGVADTAIGSGMQALFG